MHVGIRSLITLNFGICTRSIGKFKTIDLELTSSVMLLMKGVDNDGQKIRFWMYEVTTCG